jgi:hypothetical protein
MAPNQSHTSTSNNAAPPSGIRKRKRNREAPFTTNARPKKNAVNPIKSRIRDLERQLRRTSDTKLPANVRVNHERELAALKVQLEDTEKEARRQKYISRYHMVRFFERKKAEKNLRRLEKEVKVIRERFEAGDAEWVEVQSVEARRDSAKVDLNYAIYSPLFWRYCALWPKEKKKGEVDGAGEEGGNEGGDGEEDPANRGEGAKQDRGDAVMWERVKKATEEGQKALERLRDAEDWRDPENCAVKKAAPSRPKAKQKGHPGTMSSKRTQSTQDAMLRAHRENGHYQVDDVGGSDAESDGGFFE